MQTTATRTAGSHTDLLTGILNVQVRNEDKITEQDRQYCQLQQDQLYRTLDRIDRWYDIFKEEAERYREIKSFKYEDNGKVSIRNFYFNNSGDSNRLTSSTSLWTTTAMPTRILRVASFPISTGPTM